MCDARFRISPEDYLEYEDGCRLNISLIKYK